MGLQSQLNDVGSDSLPIMLVAILATWYAHLRALFSAVRHTLPRIHHHILDDNLFHISSGLAGLVAVADHRLTLRRFHYSSAVHDDDESESESESESSSPMCIFCRCHLKSGEKVCELPCKHIFHDHTDCLGGWLDQMKFNCPLCRSPIISGWRVEHTQRRVAADLATHFAVR